MPSASPGTKILFSPPPTPNGPLHLGHMSGPYVAADIAARAARAAGDDVLHVCGLDSHQNYVLARAEALGEPVQEVHDRFRGLIRDAFGLARVEHDLFIEPLADAGYREAVAATLTELVRAGAVEETDTELLTCSECARVLHHVRVTGRCGTCGEGANGGTCEGCGSFLLARDLVGATSTCCGAAPRPVTVRVPVLRMEEFREELEAYWLRGVLPPSTRVLIGRYLAAGLPEMPLAYPTDWGIPWKGEGDELRIDVWAEMALGYGVAVAAHLNPSAKSMAERAAVWSAVSELWYLCGVDNSFYYAAMIPALLAACGIPTAKQAGLVVNEFYRLDGLKFSTSRNHAVWAYEFLTEQDPGEVRAFLSWDRPDHFGTDFTVAAYEAFLADHRTAVAAAGVAGSPLADLAVARGERALRLESFDPALAVRCALSAGPAGDERAARLLRHVTGESG